MLDSKKVLGALMAKEKAKGKAPKPDVEVDLDTSGAAPDDEDTGDSDCGDRAIAAVKHGDGEAFEQAIMDIIDKAKSAT